jgi:two-component system sensor histidine kinase DegS
LNGEPAALLEAAHTIVDEQLARLRDMAQSARQRATEQESALRASERMLDEVTIQHRFAAEQGLPTVEKLAAQAQKLRREHEQLLGEHRRLRQAARQLDQFVRQIDMSSATLDGSEEGPADPWTQALRAQVIMGREEERSRLAREVHDGPAQVLANSLMGLERGLVLLSEGRLERLEAILTQLRESAREGLGEVRRFIADLRPGRLDEQGLNEAIADYVRRYRDSVATQVVFEGTNLPRLPAETEIVLYRIVQESLQNARKHAPGAPVHVTMALRDGRLVLSIRDDGPGFDPREVARRAGRESWGLTSMRERADLIGASFTVTSRRNYGTEVLLQLPIHSRNIG